MYKKKDDIREAERATAGVMAGLCGCTILTEAERAEFPLGAVGNGYFCTAASLA